MTYGKFTAKNGVYKTSQEKINHPAKYSDAFIPIFAEELKGKRKVLDPFAGTGKIGEIKRFGYDGVVYANDIEPEWIELGRNKCDVISAVDAERLPDIYPPMFFDAICTSPTYGNRMADHHNAKDGSKRNTYTHTLGHALTDGNTGKMQWGEEYRKKHTRIYANIVPLLSNDGVFILNISDHIRKGEEVPVSAWHIETLEALGMKLEEDIHIPTPRCKYGANANIRVEYEHIYVLKICRLI